MPPLDIAIIGAGAIGTALAARLAASDAQVTLVARGARADRIARNGVVLTDLDGTHRGTPEVSKRLEAPVSVLFLCVKSGALATALKHNMAGIGCNTRVVPLVNGIPWWFFGDQDKPVQAVDPGGRLLQMVPLSQIVGAVTAMTASFHLDGETVCSTIPHQLVLGPTVANGPRPVDLADTLTQAGFVLDRADNLRPSVWEKLMLNLATNPLSALTNETLAEIAANPASLNRAETLAGELGALARSFGVTIDPAGLKERLVAAGNFPTSMLQDARAGRPLELAPIVQAPLELAAERGVAMPETRALSGDLGRRFARAA